MNLSTSRHATLNGSLIPPFLRQSEENRGSNDLHNHVFFFFFVYKDQLINTFNFAKALFHLTLILIIFNINNTILLLLSYSSIIITSTSSLYNTYCM